MLDELGPHLYVAEGVTVSFCGIPYPTRMAVAKLSDASAWVWSPVALSEEFAGDVDAIGPQATPFRRASSITSFLASGLNDGFVNAGVKAGHCTGGHCQRKQI